jgi:hypothetical protein
VRTAKRLLVSGAAGLGQPDMNQNDNHSNLKSEKNSQTAGSVTNCRHLGRIAVRPDKNSAALKTGRQSPKMDKPKPSAFLRPNPDHNKVQQGCKRRNLNPPHSCAPGSA